MIPLLVHSVQLVCFELLLLLFEALVRSLMACVSGVPDSLILLWVLVKWVQLMVFLWHFFHCYLDLNLLCSFQWQPVEMTIIKRITIITTTMVMMVQYFVPKSSFIQLYIYFSLKYISNILVFWLDHSPRSASVSYFVLQLLQL